jgi:hypothetical protein
MEAASLIVGVIPKKETQAGIVVLYRAAFNERMECALGNGHKKGLQETL